MTVEKIVGAAPEFKYDKSDNTTLGGEWHKDAITAGATTTYWRWWGIEKRQPNICTNAQ